MNFKLNLQVATQNKHIPSKKKLQHWVMITLKNLKKNNNIELGIRIVNKAESKKLNEYYRSKQGPTNILSFPFVTPPSIESNYLGDLVICAPLVQEEARQQNKTLEAHWAHLIIHGTLHLFGYDHIKKKQALVMEKLETDLLLELGYSTPY